MWFSSIAFAEGASKLTDADFGTLLPPAEDNFLLYLRVATALLYFGSLLVLAFMFFKAKRLGTPTSNTRWASLFALLILPLLAVPFTLGVGLEAAKSVEACGSCHQMQPFIDDMKDPDSKNLAAIHYQKSFIQHNQCYTCHTGYGVFGAAHAKMRGLRHLWIYYTQELMPKDIRIHGEFNFSNCLMCHGRTERYRNVEEHADPDTMAGLKDGTVSCFDCHDKPHPPPEKR